MGVWPKGGSDSGVGGFVIDRCYIRPARRRAEALRGCTRVDEEGVGKSFKAASIVRVLATTAGAIFSRVIERVEGREGG